MYRRGTEVDLRYGLRILEGISNLRRSCRVLRPVQEQCQQCIVSQTYPSARKTEEKSILQLCVLPDSYTKVLAQVITTSTPLILLNKEATPFGVASNLINIMMYDRPSQGDLSQERDGKSFQRKGRLSSGCPPRYEFHSIL